MIIDSHCHLDYPNLFNDLEGTLERAKNSNVNTLLTICTTLDSFEKIKFIINKYRNIYGTFGIHPHETKKFPQVDEKYIIQMKKSSKKIIGIGETGLDYHYDHSDRNIQKKSFVNHIHASINLNIPLIIHSRNAEKDTYEILKSENKNTNLKILLHCFTGSEDFAKKLLDLNSYISFSGIITFNNSEKLTNVASKIPLNRLLVETDSPYLSPVPFRGKPNEPSYIVHTIEKLSQIFKIESKDIAANTTRNFKELFSV